MNVLFTKEQLNEILLESVTARKALLTLFMEKSEETEMEELRKFIFVERDKRIIRDNRWNKILCIKAVRAWADKNKTTKVLARRLQGLAQAKDYVEKYLTDSYEGN